MISTVLALLLACSQAQITVNNNYGGGSPGCSYGSGSSQPPANNPDYGYMEHSVGVDAGFVADNADIASAGYRYSPPVYSYVPTQNTINMQDETARISAVRQQTKEATTQLKSLLNKRNDARERIKSMDRVSERSEIVEYATDALKLSKEYYLKEDFESGSIAAKIADIFLDISTSTLPVISWVRDTYEAISGKDMLTGESLSSFSHGMAILGAVTIGFGSKVSKALTVFQKLTRIPVDSTWQTARKVLHEKRLSEVVDTIGFFKKHNIYKASDREAFHVLNAFMKNAKKEVLQEDLKVYRFYTKGFNDPRGPWVSPVKLDYPKRDLALEFDPPDMHTWIIPKGTEILKGTVAPNFGESGGAVQILLNQNLLREFK